MGHPQREQREFLVKVRGEVGERGEFGGCSWCIGFISLRARLQRGKAGPNGVHFVLLRGIRDDGPKALELPLRTVEALPNTL